MNILRRYINAFKNVKTVGLEPQTSTPDVAGGSDYQVYVRDSDKALIYDKAGSLTELGAGGGGSYGIVDWDEALTLGNANNAASSTFAYIGDAASTGFATWTCDSIAAGDYTLYWFINGYKVDGTDMTTFRVMVDTVAVTQPTANSLSGTSEYESVSRFVPLTLTSGTHTFRMQWKTVSATASVNTQSTLYFALMGPT